MTALRHGVRLRTLRGAMAIVAVAALFIALVPMLPASAASFNEGPGRSWSISAQAPGGGPITAGGPMEVTVTLVWDATMHTYEGDPCTLVGSTSDPRVPSMYFSSPSASPTSYLYNSCGVQHDLSDDFLTMRWTTTITAPSTAGSYSMRAYSRGSVFFDDTYNYSYSAPFNYTVGAAPTEPDAPTTAAATAGDGQATVSWTAPGNDGGSAITGYTVTSQPGSHTCTTAGTACTVMGLTNGTSYTFTVVATNAVGSSASSSPTSSVTPAGLPGPPTGLSATEGDGQLTVSFTLGSDAGSAVTDIEYQLDSGSWMSGEATTSPVVISGLNNGQSYTVKVRARNAIGAGAASSGLSATPAAPVAPPPAPAPTTCTAVQHSTHPCASFADVDDLDFATNRDLGWLETIGIFVGRPDGTFGFDEPLQRYEAVWVLARTHRLMFSAVLPDPSDGFVDLTAGASAEAAAQLHALGILYGTGGGQYQPNIEMRADHWALALERLALLNGVQLPSGDTALARLIAAGWLPAETVAEDPISRLDVALSVARLGETG